MAERSINPSAWEGGAASNLGEGERVILSTDSHDAAAGLIFVLLCAWPVFGFFGLDVLLVYFAFRANYRSARAYEEVTVTSSELTVRKVSHRGGVRQWTLNPLWVRLDQRRHAEFGIEKLYLVSKGHHVSIASFLGPDEKASFAKALSAALQAARRGPTLNPVT